MFETSFYRLHQNDLQEFWTLQIRANALQKCNKRNDDEFACSVHGRLQACTDLVADEVVYHRTRKANATKLEALFMLNQIIYLINFGYG